jgi:hypothetical protein
MRCRFEAAVLELEGIARRRVLEHSTTAHAKERSLQDWTWCRTQAATSSQEMQRLDRDITRKV